MAREHKTLKLELKADGESEGAFTATFATFNVIDHHGDVTVPGAYDEGKEILIGAYQHRMEALPVGKGVIRQDDHRAWVEGQFFLDTTHGDATYRTVKNAGGAMEWSYVFTVKQAEFGEFDTDQGAVPVRFLQKLDVWSVDPVLRGAGIGTRTDSIKSVTDGLTFADHAEEITAAVEDFVTRVNERVAVRAKDGRALSAANVERLGGIAESLKSAAVALEQLAADTPPTRKADDEIDADALFAGFLHAQAVANGVAA